MGGLQLGGSLGAGRRGNENFRLFILRWMVDSTTVEHREGYPGLQEGVGQERAEELVRLFVVSSHFLGCHDRLPLFHGPAQNLILHLLIGMKGIQFSEGVREVEAPTGTEMPMTLHDGGIRKCFCCK